LTLMRAYLTPRLRLSAFAVMAGLAPAIHAAPPAARLGRTAVKCAFFAARRRSDNRLPSHQFDVLAAWIAGTSPAMTMEVAGCLNEIAGRNASERQFLAQKRNPSYHLRMTHFRAYNPGARIPQPRGARKLEKNFI
jgi:hypothetical protein